jgi:hypothetical protein
MNEERMAREERVKRKIKDVIPSPKIGNKAVAEACLTWLIDKREMGREWTVANLAEAVLYLMAVDQRSDGDAAKVEILEDWMSWAQNANLRRAGVEADEKTNNPASDSEAARRLLKEKRRQGGERERSEVVIGVNLPSYALQPRNDTAVGAHCGRAGQEPEMDPRSRSRSVGRTAVDEGG